jgi:hypothetical protein
MKKKPVTLPSSYKKKSPLSRHSSLINLTCWFKPQPLGRREHLAISEAKLHRSLVLSQRDVSLLLFTVASFFILYCPKSYALSWTVNPSVQAQEIYSDNIKLAPSGSQQSAFVTAINPGISLTGQSPRSTLNFNYRMQNLYNAGGDNGLSIYNQLQSKSHNTFIPNKLFMDSNSSISQQNINNNLIGSSNINGSTNNTNVYNFGLSPYWTPHFANYASGIARVNFNTIATSGGSTVNNNLNSMSDSVNLAETINLNSGAYFQRINWNLSFNNNENYRANSQTISFQNTNGRIGVPINAYLNVFTQGGYSSNNYSSTTFNNTGNNSNRGYYTVGGQWKPSQHFNLTAGGGNNSFVTVFLSPMARLTSTTTYSNNAVGTNFGQYSPGNNGQNSGTQNPSASSTAFGGGNSGQNWTTALNYQARRSTWSLTHNNTTTTSQQILAENQIFPAQDLTNNGLSNTDINQRIINNPTLTNQVIVTKKWNLSVSFTPGKSTLTANIYNQDYTYQTIGNNQQVTGVSSSWNWPFATRTSAYVRPQWQHIDNQGSGNNSQYYTIAIGMNRTITSQLNAVLEFRHINQTSNGNEKPLQSLNNSPDYQENRVTASLFMRF